MGIPLKELQGIHGMSGTVLERNPEFRKLMEGEPEPSADPASRGEPWRPPAHHRKGIADAVAGLKEPVPPTAEHVEETASLLIRTLFEYIGLQGKRGVLPVGAEERELLRKIIELGRELSREGVEI